MSMHMGMVQTPAGHFLPLRTLLNGIVRLALQNPRPDLPHLINLLAHGAYMSPAFAALPSFTQDLILTSMSERITGTITQLRRLQDRGLRVRVSEVSQPEAEDRRAVVGRSRRMVDCDTLDSDADAVLDVD
ncbi:hypothetical protein C8Q76DRAFT_698547 [Earliella scabrosa]|nr:hypothetical protein C8Q76DRAFT_698547 [Earliella scabrosa]